MHLSLTRIAAASAIALVSGMPLAQATPVYAIANNNLTLIRLDSATPGTVITVGNFSGAVASLAGLDFRPADGQLYGYSNLSDSVYRVNPATGVTTFVSALSNPTDTNLLGIDFNPVPDRMRIVTASDQNLRVNVANGVTIVDGTLAYVAGDANAGTNPNIIDAAYTNSDRNPGTGTKLYYIDYLLDILVSTVNPNAGALVTVGALGVDTDVNTGFDILSDGLGGNFAYASLTSGGVPRLYTIDLASGAATLVGEISALNVSGLTLAPVLLPEPSSMALVGFAVLAGAMVRRRRV